MIRQALPNLSISQKHVGFLDLLALWKQIDKCPDIRLPFEAQGKLYCENSYITEK